MNPTGGHDHSMDNGRDAIGLMPDFNSSGEYLSRVRTKLDVFDLDLRNVAYLNRTDPRLMKLSIGCPDQNCRRWPQMDDAPIGRNRSPWMPDQNPGKRARRDRAFAKL